MGYSGHEQGILPSFMAVTEGAQAVERHITLDKSMYGSDQSVSLEPHEFEELIQNSRNVGQIMGEGKKLFLKEEIPIAKKLRYFE